MSPTVAQLADLRYQRHCRHETDQQQTREAARTRAADEQCATLLDDLRALLPTQLRAEYRAPSHCPIDAVSSDCFAVLLSHAGRDITFRRRQQGSWHLVTIHHDDTVADEDLADALLLTMGRLQNEARREAIFQRAQAQAQREAEARAAAEQTAAEAEDTAIAGEIAALAAAAAAAWTWPKASTLTLPRALGHKPGRERLVRRGLYPRRPTAARRRPPGGLSRGQPRIQPAHPLPHPIPPPGLSADRRGALRGSARQPDRAPHHPPAGLRLRRERPAAPRARPGQPAAPRGRRPARGLGTGRTRPDRPAPRRRFS